MTFLKHALSSIRKDLAVEILTACQLAAVICTCVVMVSVMMIRYRYYEPFKDVFESNGLYCFFDMEANDDPEKLMNGNNYLADEELRKIVPDAENIISVNHGPSWLVDDEGNTAEGQKNYDILYYDDEFISRVTPDIEEGRWLYTSENADCLEGVITENANDIKVGDKIRVQCFAQREEDVEQEVLIVGKIRENAKIIGYQYGAERSDGLNITALYGTASFEVDQHSALILSSNYLSKTSTVCQGAFGPVIITYPENYPKEKIAKDAEKLSVINCGTAVSLSEMNANTLEYLFEYLRDLLPIIIVPLVMVFVSAISSSALTTRRELKTYAVFYITGLRWKQCGIISLVRSLVITAGAGAITAIMLPFAVSTGAGGRLVLGPETVLCAAAAALFYLLVSLVMPIIMLSRTTPKQILTR